MSMQGECVGCGGWSYEVPDDSQQFCSECVPKLRALIASHADPKADRIKELEAEVERLKQREEYRSKGLIDP